MKHLEEDQNRILLSAIENMPIVKDCLEGELVIRHQNKNNCLLFDPTVL